MNTIFESQTIKELVRSRYAEIAEGRYAPGSFAQDADTDQLAAAVGYEASRLAMAPEGANLGLSCGNPLAAVEVQKGQTVLDLGSGGGLDVFLAGLMVKESGRAIGVDMTPQMLEKARGNIRQYRERTGLDNVEFRLGEIEHLPVADNSVDVVVANCVISLATDKNQVWSEVYRTLKPGGQVSVTDLALLKPLPEHVCSLNDAIVGCVAGAVLVEVTQAMLEKTGFHNIQLRPQPEYVQGMLQWNGPMYHNIAYALPEGETMADYIVSLSITARKP